MTAILLIESFNPGTISGIGIDVPEVAGWRPWDDFSRTYMRGARVVDLALLREPSVRRLRFGRTSRLEPPAIVVNEGATNRHHADIAWDGERFTVCDLKTTGGLFFNDGNLTNFGRPVPLSPGDYFSLGAWTHYRATFFATGCAAPDFLADVLGAGG